MALWTSPQASVPSECIHLWQSSTGCSVDVCSTIVLSVGCREISSPLWSSPQSVGESCSSVGSCSSPSSPTLAFARFSLFFFFFFFSLIPHCMFSVLPFYRGATSFADGLCSKMCSAGKFKCYTKI